MAVTTTPRFGLTRWSAGSDPFNRAQLDTSMANLEARAALLSDVSALRLSDVKPPTQAVSLGGYGITNLLAPTNGTDAANKTYVDTAVANMAQWSTRIPLTLATTDWPNWLSTSSATLTGATMKVANSALSGAVPFGYQTRNDEVRLSGDLTFYGSVSYTNGATAGTLYWYSVDTLMVTTANVPAAIAGGTARRYQAIAGYYPTVVNGSTTANVVVSPMIYPNCNYYVNVLSSASALPAEGRPAGAPTAQNNPTPGYRTGNFGAYVDASTGIYLQNPGLYASFSIAANATGTQYLRFNVFVDMTYRLVS